MTDIWGNFIWSFTEILTDYIRIKYNEKEKLIDYITDSYYKLIRYYMYMVRYKIPGNRLFGKKELPLSNSVLATDHGYHELKIKKLHSLKGVEFLLYKHMQFIIDHKFNDMSEAEIRDYIEREYLVEFYNFYQEIHSGRHIDAFGGQHEC